MSAHSIIVSYAPDELERMQGLSVGIELKFDWEHKRLLTGERSLTDVLAEAPVNTNRIESVHLPPGLVSSGDKVGMAITESNRGTIVDFVFSQLSTLPDADLIAHPAKQFEIPEFLELVAEIGSVTDRDLAIENTSVESDWYTPAQLAYFARIADTHDRLNPLWLTVDSGHLPQYGRDYETRLPDEVGPVADRTAETRFTVPDLESSFKSSLDAAHSHLKTDTGFSETEMERISQNPYYPLVATFATAGHRIREIHFNDPLTDRVPDVDAHNDRPLLTPVIDYLRKYEPRIVFEPYGVSPDELRSRIDALQRALSQDP